jgi:hypothetical protein
MEREGESEVEPGRGLPGASTTNDPTFLFDALPLHWQMTRWEKYGFSSILEASNPKVAIEIGTHKGGSLQVIAKYAEKHIRLT